MTIAKSTCNYNWNHQYKKQPNTQIFIHVLVEHFISPSRERTLNSSQATFYSHDESQWCVNFVSFMQQFRQKAIELCGTISFRRLAKIALSFFVSQHKKKPDVDKNDIIAKVNSGSTYVPTGLSLCSLYWTFSLLIKRLCKSATRHLSKCLKVQSDPSDSVCTWFFIAILGAG